MGVVYYANYLRFFEGARNEWIRALGLAYTEIEARGVMLPVLEAGVRYLRPARYDDVLEVHLDVSHTRVKVRFDYVVKRQAVGAAGAPGTGEALCLGHTVHACVSREGRPTRAPDWLLQALEPRSRRRKTLEAPEDQAAAAGAEVA